MIETINKLQILWKKRQQLTNILLERKFIEYNYAEQISSDEKKFETKVAKLRNEVKEKFEKKEDLGNLNEKIQELDEKIREIKYYKNLVETSHKSEEEIKTFITIIKHSF